MSQNWDAQCKVSLKSLGPIHTERLRLRHRQKWVTWSSMGLFTFSDGEHQKKGNVAIANAVTQCEQALNFGRELAFYETPVSAGSDNAHGV